MMNRWTEQVERWSMDVFDNKTGESFTLIDECVMNIFPKFKHNIQYGRWSISFEDMKFLGLGIIEDYNGDEYKCCFKQIDS